MVTSVTRPALIVNLRTTSEICSMGSTVVKRRAGTLYRPLENTHSGVQDWMLPDSQRWNELNLRERTLQLGPLFEELREVQFGNDLQVIFHIVRVRTLPAVMETACAILHSGILNRSEFQFVISPVLYRFNSDKLGEIIGRLEKKYGFERKQFVRTDSADSSRKGRF